MEAAGGIERIKSSMTVNQSTNPLNRTSEVMTDMESEKGSLKYVTAGVDNPHLQKQYTFSKSLVEEERPKNIFNIETTAQTTDAV